MSSRHQFRIRRAALAGLTTFVLASGCVFVEVDEAAEAVGVLKTADEASDCQPKGRVSARTKTNIGYARRSEEKILLELERIARNEAVELGANTIVPDGPATQDGRRSYQAYFCPE